MRKEIRLKRSADQQHFSSFNWPLDQKRSGKPTSPDTRYSIWHYIHPLCNLQITATSSLHTPFYDPNKVR
uniref:Uncharacterized protein n=1 Tax=Utricularia reniformis TaxID=192314 RepID=A0A1Y0B0B1_9LAMI|nr:hypothetical protein AEK19_MT0610 [Utricularia reniformis]ART30865.1 hypothetical protein AEK19_MT0610 [Utricularia reniformis]